MRTLSAKEWVEGAEMVEGEEACYVCGSVDIAVMSNGAKFCNSCGQQLYAGNIEQVSGAPPLSTGVSFAGAQVINFDARHRSHHPSSLGTEETQIFGSIAAVPASEAQVLTPDARQCSNDSCGKIALNEHYKYCSQCGKELPKVTHHLEPASEQTFFVGNALKPREYVSVAEKSEAPCEEDILRLEKSMMAPRGWRGFLRATSILLGVALLTFGFVFLSLFRWTDDQEQYVNASSDVDTDLNQVAEGGNPRQPDATVMDVSRPSRPSMLRPWQFPASECVSLVSYNNSRTSRGLVSLYVQQGCSVTPVAEPGLTTEYLPGFCQVWVCRRRQNLAVPAWWSELLTTP